MLRIPVLKASTGCFGVSVDLIGTVTRLLLETLNLDIAEVAGNTEVTTGGGALTGGLK